MSEAKKQTLKQYNEPSVLSNLDKTDKKQYNTREILAKEIGVGQGTIGRVEVILKEAPEEVKDNYYIYIYIGFIGFYVGFLWFPFFIGV